MSQSLQHDGFSFNGIVEPPVLARQIPILKDEDPYYKRPQLTPFFNSQQFKLWDDGELERYNQLMNVLMKWAQFGWCMYDVKEEFNKGHQNWFVWVQWISQAQVPVEEIEAFLQPNQVSPEFGVRNG